LHFNAAFLSVSFLQVTGVIQGADERQYFVQTCGPSCHFLVESDNSDNSDVYVAIEEPASPGGGFIGIAPQSGLLGSGREEAVFEDLIF
jgi:hypothetical protein